MRQAAFVLLPHMYGKCICDELALLGGVVTCPAQCSATGRYYEIARNITSRQRKQECKFLFNVRTEVLFNEAKQKLKRLTLQHNILCRFMYCATNQLHKSKDDSLRPIGAVS